MANLEKLHEIKEELKKFGATLIAVSKTKPASEIMEVYNAGHLDFGENYVQELLDKHASLPENINWHFIGHLQTNKVKQIGNFTTLIHGVDSEKLLRELYNVAQKENRKINCLCQVHIASEETKFGLGIDEVTAFMENAAMLKEHITVRGLMGMASNTDDKSLIKKEFSSLHKIYDLLKPNYGFDCLSMGMTSDYKIALECGSTMVRIGSALFGEREKKQTA